jgi:hypothetical protein
MTGRRFTEPARIEIPNRTIKEAILGMSYDLHITRRENWSSGRSGISLAEWLAYVDHDPEMRLDGFAEIVAPDGAVIRMESEGLAVWTAHPLYATGFMAWFNHSPSGRVTVASPDEECMKKMWHIAQALNARVQGDEGEFYDADGNIVNRPP